MRPQLRRVRMRNQCRRLLLPRTAQIKVAGFWTTGFATAVELECDFVNRDIRRELRQEEERLS